MTSASTDSPRIWGGTTLAARRAARREKLLEVGLDLLGAPAPATLSVRAVCRGAHLTERYFYESFPDRDALVLAVFDELAAEARTVLESATAEADGPAEASRNAVEALMTLMIDDPRKGRVLLVAPLTEHVLAEPSQALLPALSEIIRSQLPRRTSRERQDLIAVGLLGSLMALFYVYLHEGMQVSRAAFVDHCVQVLLSAEHLAEDVPV